MDNPYRWLKRRWYRRQARRAIWFLRYIDRTFRDHGMTRVQARGFWGDFIKHPEVRHATLNQFAVLNKVKIRAERKLRAEQRLEQALVAIQKLNKDLTAVRAEHAQCRRPETVPQREVNHEVHGL